MKRAIVFGVLAFLVTAAPAWAQDSTSIASAIGDAVFCTDPAEQVNTYVVDTQVFTSSWGQQYRIAPLVKASKIGWSYLNGLISAQGISNRQLSDQPFAFGSYALWTSQGYGVNAGFNLPPPQNVNTTGWRGNQFAVGFADYGRADGGSNADSSNIVGAIVNYKPEQPHRLYVARIEAAVNIDDVLNAFEQGRAAFGFGAVDAHGNVHFRADDYRANGANPLVGEHYFRVHLPSRNPNGYNLLDALGTKMDPFPATCWVMNCFACTAYNDTHSCPTILPQQLGGPRVLGADFSANYVYEFAGCPNPAVVRTPAHRPPASINHRGCVSFSSLLTCGDSVGTAGMLGQDVNNKTRIINLWRVAADGSVVIGPGSPIALDPTYALGLPGGAFDGYHGTHAFNGGNGLVAIGQDKYGRGLAAATWYKDGTATDEENMILVARFNCSDPNPNNAEWTIAAKATIEECTPILDGPGGTPIGKLARRLSGGNYVGPSISAPAMDAAGNLYFIAVCEIFGSPNYFPYCLVRAVYDPATFSYELELLLESGAASASYGSVLRGLNSDTDYKITYLTLAYASGLSSGSFFSGNVMQTGFNNMNIGQLSNSDPRTLGGLVLAASIVYDADNDGVFNPTVGGPDEPYSVLLYIGADDSGPVICRGDLNCDGKIDFGDINPFVLRLSNPAGYFSLYPNCPDGNGDINASGVVGFDDINPFVRLLSGSQLPIPCP